MPEAYAKLISLRSCFRFLLKYVILFHLQTKTKCVNISQSREDVIQKFQEFVSVLWRDTESLKSITLYVFAQIIREIKFCLQLNTEII